MKPSAVHVGNIVQGARMAGAQGRDLGIAEEEADTSRKVSLKILILMKPLTQGLEIGQL